MGDIHAGDSLRWNATRSGSGARHQGKPTGTAGGMPELVQELGGGLLGRGGQHEANHDGV